MSRHALFGVPVLLLGAALLSCTSPPPYSPMITPSPSMAPTATPVATATPAAPESTAPTATPSAAASTGATASASPQTSPTPSATPSATASSSAIVASGGTVSFKADVVPVLKNHCADCHTQGGRGSLSVLMFGDNEEPNFPVIRQTLANMIRQISIGRMPQGLPGTVPDADLQVLKDWQAAGSPNN